MLAARGFDGDRGACCGVRTAAAGTGGRAGAQLAPMAERAALGVRLFTDDGDGVQDPQLMRRAMEYARGLGVIVAEQGRFRVRERTVLRYYAKTIEHLFATPGRPH